MMGITTQIRTAIAQDIPHIMSLAEIEYNCFVQQTPFSIEMCERYIHTVMLDPDAVFMVIVDNRNIPFGYLTAGLDFVDLSTEATAIAQHWFIHNPNQQYGRRNYGLELIAAFEGWAKYKKAKKTMVSMRMNPGQRKSYDKTFKSIDYIPNYVSYSKQLK